MLLLLLSLSLPVFAGQVHDLPCDADICSIPYDKEGNQNGMETCYEDETKAKVVRELFWKDGAREGTAKCWRNGKLKFEAEYKNDALNGLFIEYDYDSTGDRVSLLQNGEETGLNFRVKNGKVIRVDSCVIDGVPAFEAALSCAPKDYGKFNGALAIWKKEELAKNRQAAAKEAKRLNGPQESKYASGQIRAKWNHKDGEIEGKFLSYFESGKIQTDCEYKNGKHEGPCLEYDQEGRLDKREMYSAGKLTKAETFFDNGKPKEVITYGDQGRSCVVEYFDSGIKSRSGCYLEKNHYGYYYYYSWRSHSPDGEYQSWYDNGDLLEKGQYKDGKRIGKWESYADKELDGEYFYENGVLVKTVEYYRKAPQYRMVREYMPDGSLRNETRLEGLSGDRPKVI